MNKKFVIFISNFMHALSANVVRLLISISLTLLLPKLLGVEEYSYWQLYLFYVTYTAYSSMGWCEGTYLKYGGKEYSELNPSVMASQFWTLAIYEVVFCIVCGGIFMTAVSDNTKQLILIFALISSLFDILRYQCQNILQATNRIREFARVVTSERILFFAITIMVLALGCRDYHLLILGEILARIISMIYGMILCRRIVFARLQPVKMIYEEAKELLNGGFKLLVATLASQLVIGIVRFAIENKWGTIVFGKVSLTLSLSNMIITCISAVSIVLFPTLKKMDNERLKDLYGTMRTVLTVPVLAVLILYVPMKYILTLWLPQYEDSMRYLAVLLPICIYEIRSFALVNTYFKAFRKENQILLCNLLTVGLSIILSGASVYLFENLDVAIFAIVILMIFKSCISEYVLAKYMHISVLKDNIMEILLTVIFVISSWGFGNILSVCIYAIAYMLYLFVKRGDIKREMMAIKGIVRRKE